MHLNAKLNAASRLAASLPRCLADSLPRCLVVQAPVRNSKQKRCEEKQLAKLIA